jgi:hypothetical protein
MTWTFAANSARPGLSPGLGQGDPDREFGAIRQELVQRRVKQPNIHRQPIHRVEEPVKSYPGQGRRGS